MERVSFWRGNLDGLELLVDRISNLFEFVCTAQKGSTVCRYKYSHNRNRYEWMGNYDELASERFLDAAPVMMPVAGQKQRILCWDCVNNEEGL